MCSSFTTSIYLALLSNCIAAYDNAMKKVMDKFSVSRVESDVILFLANNPQFHTAADIVKERHLTKSHVSLAVSKLVERGFLKRSCEKNNRKSILLEITPLAEPLITFGREAQQEFASQLVQGFTEEEVQQLRHFHEQMNKNLTKKEG